MKSQLGFLAATLATSAISRGGASRISINCSETGDGESAYSDAEALNIAFGKLIFDSDASALSLLAEQSVLAAEIAPAAPAGPNVTLIDQLEKFSATTRAFDSTFVAVPHSGAPTTVAVPLPPAAVGGGIFAATLLGRPLLGFRRRRRAATTFRS